ncbi:MAG: adenine phosphoribosyltransferase [Thermoplasmatales archaeon]|nr:adenine phosphoribosyltransferase [Thermoplasmatales archaeon]
MLKLLRESVASSPIIEKSGYHYMVNPVTDGVPRMRPELQSEIIDAIAAVGDFEGCDCLIAPESMGIPLAVPLGMKLGIPYVIVRKRAYGLPGEVSFEQRTGYSGSRMYINGLERGERVVVVDDVVSTGGTMVSLIRALRDGCGCEIGDVITVFEKGGGAAIVEEATGVRVKTLLPLKYVEGKGFEPSD